MAVNRVNAKISLIPKVRGEAKVTTIGQTQENNDVFGVKNVGSRLVAGKVNAVPRRIGLAVLDKNVRRAAVLPSGKKVVGAEAKDDVVPGKAVVTRKISPDVKKAESEKVKDVLRADSLKPVDVFTYFSADLIDSLPDPDADDLDIEVLCSEYVKDIMDYLSDRELEMPVASKYMKGQKYLLPRHRRLLVDWLLHLCGKFKLAPETLYQTIYILDAFCQAKTDVPTTRYQLIGMTALVIASKFEEVYPPSIEDVIAMCDRAFKQDDLLKAEREILRVLKFNVNRPTPITFLRRYSKVADVDTNVHAMAKFLIELTVTEYELVGVRPSKVAAAALFLALKLNAVNDNPEAVNDDSNPEWTDLIAYYAKYPAEVIKPMAYELCALVRKSEHVKEKGFVTSKYPGLLSVLSRDKAFVSFNKTPVSPMTVLDKYASTKYYKVAEDRTLQSRLVTQWASRAMLVIPDEPSKAKTSPRAAEKVRPKLAIKRVGTGSGNAKPSALASRPPFRP